MVAVERSSCCPSRDPRCGRLSQLAAAQVLPPSADSRRNGMFHWKCHFISYLRALWLALKRELQCFEGLPHSLTLWGPSERRLSVIQSIVCALFRENDRGGGICAPRASVSTR